MPQRSQQIIIPCKWAYERKNKTKQKKRDLVFKRRGMWVGGETVIPRYPSVHVYSRPTLFSSSLDRTFQLFFVVRGRMHAGGAARLVRVVGPQGLNSEGSRMSVPCLVLPQPDHVRRDFLLWNAASDPCPPSKVFEAHCRLYVLSRPHRCTHFSPATEVQLFFQQNWIQAIGRQRLNMEVLYFVRFNSARNNHAYMHSNRSLPKADANGARNMPSVPF